VYFKDAEGSVNLSILSPVVFWYTGLLNNGKEREHYLKLQKFRRLFCVRAEVINLLQ